MAYYAYKEVRDLIPDWFRDQFIEEYNKTAGKYPYDGDSNYDGDMWYLTAAYIEYLHAQVRKEGVDATTH